MGEQQQIDEAAKQFEGILMRQFLEEALKTADGEGGLLGSSIPMYDHIIKDTLATSITKGRPSGYRQFCKRNCTVEPKERLRNEIYNERCF